MVLLVDPTADDFYVWIDDLVCGQPIPMSVLYISIIFLAVMYSTAISASAADAITDLMICAIVNTAPFSLGFGSFS